MKNFVVLSLIFLSMTIDYMRELIPTLPPSTVYLFDLLIAAVTIVLIVRVIILKTWVKLPIGLILLFSGFFYVCIAGVFLNDLASETTVAGFRYFFRFAPLFLIAYAYRLEEDDIRRYMRWIVIMLLLQIPLSIWQRFFAYETTITGDIVVGSLGSSSSLALFAAMAIAASIAALLDRQIASIRTLLLSLLFLVPAGLAETKITPFLLVIGVVAVLYTRRHQLDFKRTVFIGASSAMLLGTFMLMYDVLYSAKQGLSFTDLVFDSERSYHYQDIKIADDALSSREHPSFIISDPKKFVEADDDGVVTQAGRIDAMLAPFRVLLPDHPEALVIGLGIGNTSSNLGEGGRYRQLEIDLGGTTTTISHLLWETGVVGTVLYVLFILSVLLRALRCSELPGFAGLFGTQMFAATAILTSCMLYTDYFFKPEILTAFTIFAGHISVLSRTTRQARQYAGSSLVDAGNPDKPNLSAV